MVFHEKTDSLTSTTSVSLDQGSKIDQDRFLQTNLSSTATDSTVASSASSQETAIVDIYPYGTDIDELYTQGCYSNVKVVHWIRHAQGFHNVGNAQSRANLDARLTPLGENQCQGLASLIRDAPEGSRYNDVQLKTEIIVTSPVTRCIQTAKFSLEPVLEHNRNNNKGIPIIANESIRETVNFNCDRRRPIHEIAQDFPDVDFSLVPTDHDAIWEYYEKLLGDDEEFTENRESAEIHTIADRTRQFFDWLCQRPETHVAVCCHATVSRCIFNFGQSSGKTPTDVPQALDPRDEKVDVPVVSYGDEETEAYMREDFKNCELRSMVLAFK